jgi:hypothetical protein
MNWHQMQDPRSVPRSKKAKILLRPATDFSTAAHTLGQDGAQ